MRVPARLPAPLRRLPRHRVTAPLRALPRPARAALAVALVALAVAAAAALWAGGARTLIGPAGYSPALADPVPYDGRSPVARAGRSQRVIVELPRPALGALAGVATMSASARRDYLASLKREARALRSALGARGVPLRRVMPFGKTLDGFAATVPTTKLAELTSLGVRAQPVQRLYPATSEPVAVPGAIRLPPVPPAGQAPVAVLDTGAALPGGRAARGYDAVQRDTDAAPGRDPRDTTRREASGTALAGVLAAAGERVLPIRVASLRAESDGTVDAAAGSDALIAGLERAVDPNGDLNTADHVPVALIGVNAPYAGFDDSPEARAVAAATRLGTLVVAPAGNEGAARPGSATVGSPAAAPDSLAVGALAGPEPAAGVRLEGGGLRVAQAAVLGGAPPRSAGLRTTAVLTSADPARLAQARLAGKLALVRAGANPAAQAAAAAAAGARAVVLAEPRARPLPAMAAGRTAVPVIGVTGAGAAALLKLKAGTELRFGATARRARSDAPPAARVSPYTSAGPTAAGTPKPDLAAPGSALTLAPGAGAAVAGGTAVAAARVAAAAARLAREHPRLAPRALRAALVGAADPARLPVARAGAGALRAPAGPVAAAGGGQLGGAAAAVTGAGAGSTADGAGRAAATGPPGPGAIVADPSALAGRARPDGRGRLTLRLIAAARVAVTIAGARARPRALTLAPGRPHAVRITIARAGAGRILVRSGARILTSVPYALAPREAAPVPLGALSLSGPADEPDGVRFKLGAFDRGDPLTTGSAVRLADRLVLELTTSAGAVRQTLTSPGGARQLMPAEYGYTVSRADLEQLPRGSYAFRAVAHGPGRTPAARGRSPSFTR